MHPRSLRGWLAFVSLLFSVFVVGGVALTTYVIVADGMQVVAYQTDARLADAVTTVVREAVAESEAAAHQRGLAGQEAAEVALADLRRRLPELLNGVDFTESFVALYTDGSSPYWASANTTPSLRMRADRQQALESGKSTRSTAGRSTLLHGLVGDAQLGSIVEHVPLTLPGGAVGVLDVGYRPHTEERVINAIRLPMVGLAAVSMLIMVVVIQTSMVWVLNLVDDLRKAADSIEAGHLDARLPDFGRNEIDALARSINKLIERLQRRADAQARFVADASHELATPVAGIRGYTSILRAWGADDPKVREEAVDAIDRESKRMARLTRDLLNLLHADEGVRLRMERIDINAIARERLAATASRYLEKDIEFTGTMSDALPMIGDPDRIEDVLSILLDNAGKYTPPNGSVSLATKRQHDEIVVTVSDTGRGIAPDDLPRLFDRFYRSEEARSDGETGFGLGLAIAKSIVDSMGGTITARSELGVGTTFTVVMPRGRV